jgi:hypothetical protein
LFIPVINILNPQSPAAIVFAIFMLIFEDQESVECLIYVGLRLRIPKVYLHVLHIQEILKLVDAIFLGLVDEASK